MTRPKLSILLYFTTILYKPADDEHTIDDEAQVILPSHERPDLERETKKGRVRQPARIEAA